MSLAYPLLKVLRTILAIVALAGIGYWSTINDDDDAREALPMIAMRP